MATRPLQLRLRDQEIVRLYEAVMRGEKPCIDPLAYKLEQAKTTKITETQARERS